MSTPTPMATRNLRGEGGRGLVSVRSEGTRGEGMWLIFPQQMGKRHALLFKQFRCEGNVASLLIKCEDRGKNVREKTFERICVKKHIAIQRLKDTFLPRAEDTLCEGTAFKWSSNTSENTLSKVSFQRLIFKWCFTKLFREIF